MKKALLMCLLLSTTCLAQLGTIDDPYQVAFGDTIIVQWDKPAAGPTVRWYKLYYNDGTMNITTWYTQGDTIQYAPAIAYLSVDIHRMWLTAGNNAGESDPSNSVYVNVTEAAPGPPLLRKLIIKKREY